MRIMLKAKLCKFGNILHSLFHDRTVIGISDKSKKKKLNEENSARGKAIKVCQITEHTIMQFYPLGINLEVSEYLNVISDSYKNLPLTLKRKVYEILVT